ncbi:MAG: hypothetical protein WBV94_31475 [Blastocatellia bacterium]
MNLQISLAVSIKLYAYFDLLFGLSGAAEEQCGKGILWITSEIFHDA